MRTARPLLRSFLSVFVLAALALAGARSQAAEFIVTKTTDDAAGCTVSDCSLRAAIGAANASPGPDVVTLPEGIYTLSLAGSLEDANLTGDLDVTDDVTIRGLGSGATVSAAQIDRVFDVIPINVGPLQVTFRNLEIRDGSAGGDECGGGISAYDPGVEIGGQTSVFLDRVVLRNNQADTGGGLCNWNNATLTDSEVRDNQAVFFGGGIDNLGSVLDLERSTVAGNTAASDGGGIDNTNGILSAANSTFSGNQAGDGGAIFNNLGDATLTGVTVAGNTAVNSANGIQNLDGVLTLDHVILANPGGADCAGGGTIVSQKYNIESGASCGLTGAGDLQNTDPLLSALDAYGEGGSVRAHVPMTGSPAIDLDVENLCLATLPLDQYGVDRPQDGDGDGDAFCDSGAVEVVPPAISDCLGQAVLDDANGNGAADVAALCEQTDMLGNRQAFVFVADGQTGSPIVGSDGKIPVNLAEYSRIESAGDVNGSGSSDVAVLGGDGAGKIIVRVHDGLTGTLIRSIPYFNPAGSSRYQPVGMVVAPSVDGNGTAEIGVVAVDSADNGRQIVQFRDAGTGAFVVNDFFLDGDWGSPPPGADPDAPQPGLFAVLPDLGGGPGPELGMLAVNQTTGQIVVMVKDIATNGFLRNVFFLNNAWDALGVVAVPGFDANPGDELGLMARNRGSGQIVLMIKDAGTNTFIVNDFHLGSQWTPLAASVVAGFDANAGPETAVLGRNKNSGKWAIQIRDAATNGFANNLFPLSAGWTVKDLRSLPSVGGGAAPDFALLARRDSDGVWVIQLMDAQTDQVLRNIFLK